MRSSKVLGFLCSLCIFVIVFTLPKLSLGQTSKILPPDDAYPPEVPEGVTTNSEGETLTPLPPVSREPKAAPPALLPGKNRQYTQNETNTLNGCIGYSGQCVPACCPQETYPPGPLKLFIRQMIEDWQENNKWPEPFPELDRPPVHSTMETMIQNGWRRQNLLSDFHFEPETGQLNAAGQEKLRWILWEVPEKHRMVYVARTVNPSETAARLGSVQKLASQLVRSGETPPILESELPPIGWPSSQIEIIHRKFLESTPVPRLKPSDCQTNNP